MPADRDLLDVSLHRLGSKAHLFAALAPPEPPAANWTAALLVIGAFLTGALLAAWVLA